MAGCEASMLSRFLNAGLVDSRFFQAATHAEGFNCCRQDHGAAAVGGCQRGRQPGLGALAWPRAAAGAATSAAAARRAAAGQRAVNAAAAAEWRR